MALRAGMGATALEGEVVATETGIVGDVCAISHDIPLLIPFLCSVSFALHFAISLPMPFVFMRAVPMAGTTSADIAFVRKQAFARLVCSPVAPSRPAGPTGTDDLARRFIGHARMYEPPVNNHLAKNNVCDDAVVRAC